MSVKDALGKTLLRALRRYFPDDPAPRTRQVPVIQSGQTVTHDRALTYSAVFSAVRVISESIAALPWHVYLERTDGSNERRSSSPVEFVLNRRPNPEMTPFSWRSTLMSHAPTWGNGYSEIERDLAGRVANLWLLPPDRMEVRRDPIGRLYYRCHSRKGYVDFAPEDIYHVSGLGYDGIVGYSVISLAARTIGLGLAAEEFGGSLFGNGVMPWMALKSPSRLSQEAIDRLELSLKQKFTGSSNAFRAMILEEGLDISTLGIPPEDAQFLETRRFQVQDVARWFRVPPHKLADLERATFSNIEHQNKEFVQESLIPWIVRLEQEADRKLFAASARRTAAYTKINANALLRGDMASRAAFYEKMFMMGALSINEMRAKEDEDPIGPDGDKRFVPLNLTTLDQAGEQDMASPERTEAPGELPQQPEAEEDMGDEADAAAETED